MSAVVFDTLKLARHLEGAGFSREQATGVATALGEGLSSEVATKADVAQLRAEVKADLADLRAELKTDIASFRAEVKSDIASLGRATAQWIITAVMLNTGALVAAVAAVWALARR